MSLSNDARARGTEVPSPPATRHRAALWKDPAYIEVQARERLKFVRVGDRAYTVIDPSAGDASAPAAERPVVAAPMANAASPWYGKV